MYYLLFYEYVENILERRTPYRSAHLAAAQAAHARGDLVIAGALADPVDRALLVFKVDNPQVVEDFVHNDPYVQNGLVTAWQIRPWTVVIGG
ncbi:MAG: YciI-like protein [Caldilinea sp.]